MAEVIEISLGVVQTTPYSNIKIKSKSEYNDQLAIKLAKYNNIPIEEVKEYMKYE